MIKIYILGVVILVLAVLFNGLAAKLSLVSLTDIAPSATSWKNNVISLSVGYTLKSSKK